MSENSWIIELDDKVMHEVDIYLENERWKQLSVYRLPASIIKLNPNAYTPQVVSFGPCYHGRDNLKPMEEHKHRALLHFLRRSGKPIVVYLEKLSKVVDDLQAAYQSLDDQWRGDTEKFLQIMIVDGCFMLEILRIFTRRVEGYAESDPIFSNHGIVYLMPDIMRDMLMIENQLPMLVLHVLVAAEGASGTQVEDYVNKLLFRLYNLDSYSRHKSIDKPLHVLDICHRVLLLPSDAQRLPQKWPCWVLEKTMPQKWPCRVLEKTMPQKWPSWVLEKTIPSATELQEAGIEIQRSKSRSLQNIRFCKGVFGVTLEVPVIVVDNISETFFLNLLAFERLHVGAGREVTNYLAFINNIIRDSKDISLLRSCGIIQNSLGRDEVVVDLFNSLTRDITIDPDSSVYLVEKTVIKYCSSPWVRWRANIVRTYFKSPWALLIGSMFLFASTFGSFAQTGYTIVAYYRRP